MADISDLSVQITVTVRELVDLVALLNLAAESFGPEDELPEIIDAITGMYFELVGNIKGGISDALEASG